MSKPVEIRIGNEAYPCYPTMGAMLRFKDLTGKEVTEINGSSLSDLCKYMWCCVKSASKRSGKDFPLDLMDFADEVDLATLQEWQCSVAEEHTVEEGEKKRVSE